MDIVTTPAAIITAAVLISALAWAVTASIMAYNSGTAYNEMAERHNSVVDALRKTEAELETVKCDLKTARSEAEHHYLKGLQKIDQLTADRDRLQALYTEASNKLSKYHRPRDPKTGKIVKAPKPTRENSEGFAAINEMMDNAIEKLNGLKIRKIVIPNGKLCDEINANAVEDVKPSCDGDCGMNYCDDNGCKDNPTLGDMYISPAQFIALMRGEA